jgi:hypothetical protein
MSPRLFSPLWSRPTGRRSEERIRNFGKSLAFWDLESLRRRLAQILQNRLLNSHQLRC